MAKLADTNGPEVLIGTRRVKAQINQSAEAQTIYSDRPTVDPKWRYTDTNGHDHYYEHGYPTLDFIIDEQHWCDGREGIYNHDPHWAIDEAHYECRQCRKRIEPGTIPAGVGQTIATTRSIDVTVYADIPFEEADGAVFGVVGRFLPISQSFASDNPSTSEFAFVPDDPAAMLQHP